jgi:hypothetical protein
MKNLIPFPTDGNPKKPRKLYRQINVWEHIEEGRVAVYRCFEVLPDKKFFVQSKDFFSFPLAEETLRLFQEQFLELLAQEWEEERETYDSLEEAIQRDDEAYI